MELIKEILIDSLNGFSPKFIPFFLFQLLVAGFLGHILQKIVNRKFGADIIQYGGLIALSVALLVSFVKYSLPFAVIAAAVLFFLTRSKEFSFHQVLGLFLVGLIGVGCGVGSIVQTGMGFVVLIAVVLFTSMKK